MDHRFCAEAPRFDRRDGRFSKRLSLRNADTDQFHHVNNAAIASFFEEARMAIFLQVELASCMAGRNVVVARLEIDFLGEIFYPGDIDIWTAPMRTGTSSFELAQGLFVSEQLCAQARATCVLLNSADSKPVALPAAFRWMLTPNKVHSPGGTQKSALNK